MTTTAAPPPALRPPRRKRRARIDDRGWLFVAPFALVFALVFLAPLAYSVYLSLFRDQLIGGNAFVGFANYITAFGDEKFWDGFGRVGIFLVVQVPIMLILALAAALAIDSARLHAAGFYRIVIFLPYAVPAVVAVLMWGYIYGDQFGLTRNLNDLLGGQFVQPFLPEWMLLSIGNIVTWQFVGYNMLIFYSSLKTIPTELYEAASIDGAGAWRTIFSIKIPAVRGAVVIATIFSIIGSFQLFNEPNILKPLAPNVISTFFTPNMYAYNLSFAGQQYNYAATIAIIMGVITAVIAYVVQLRGSRQEAR
ncbi:MULTISPECIES: carbohydrate ABC transporter permease [Microbacterium]|jgi:multiple sugar transport system permease protein|uniref:Sugar ABC transporter permease n=2 Tax=Microbacterium testaceum TaxID=2033 RepID=A0A147F3K4_MICTE|nr:MULTISPECIES: sugar ABC transporter permease [Microbacterium]KTS06784.1 sugar ABC transporter permease [Microbacterium testaceum]KTS07897.1 sugar ABC transporter permease [Microbacterium testaceum]KTS58442.1 sugar ABC transporter permease [Microbacterium testaceum]KTS82136.1 sugar ABC transporter permease [Microbacterium testaceum]MDQ1075527.1 multiple sugar transport system permease protein [Microbacterium sp. SORGH_AS_0969]